MFEQLLSVIDLIAAFMSDGFKLIANGGAAVTNLINLTTTLDGSETVDSIKDGVKIAGDK